MILKNSLGSTRVQYILRASPCASHPALVRFDELQRAILGRISNCELSDQHWMQANLPVRCGGLGIRSVALLAPSAFLASAAATLPTQAALLPVNFQPRDGFVEGVVGIWSAKYSFPTPDASRAVKQRSWDEASIRHALQCLLGSCSDDISKARLLAAQAPHSGDWLNAMPVSSCGLRLDDEAVRVAIGLRLGVNLCAPHGCPCGAMVDALGIHGLSCRKSAGRTSRHNMLNDIIFRACIRSGVPASKEPTGLFLNDEKRTEEWRWFLGKSADVSHGMLRVLTRSRHLIVKSPLMHQAQHLNEPRCSSISSTKPSRLFTICTYSGRNPRTYKRWGHDFPPWIGWSTVHSVSWPEGNLILIPESVRLHAAG